MKAKVKAALAEGAGGRTPLPRCCRSPRPSQARARQCREQRRLRRTHVPTPASGRRTRLVQQVGDRHHDDDRAKQAVPCGGTRRQALSWSTYDSPAAAGSILGLEHGHRLVHGQLPARDAQADEQGADEERRSIEGEGRPQDRSKTVRPAAANGPTTEASRLMPSAAPITRSIGAPTISAIPGSRVSLAPSPGPRVSPGQCDEREQDAELQVVTVACRIGTRAMVSRAEQVGGDAAPAGHRAGR